MAGKLPVRVRLGDGTSKTLNERFTQMQNAVSQGRQQQLNRGGFGGPRQFNGPMSYEQRLRKVQDGRVERPTVGGGSFKSAWQFSQQRGFGRGARGRGFGGLNRAAAATNFGARRGGAGGGFGGAGVRGRGGSSGGGGPPRFPRPPAAGGGRGGRSFSNSRGRSRGRGRGFGGGNGGGGGGNGGAASKEALDRELDAYMQNTGSALNRNLSAYYSEAKNQDDF